MTRSAGLLHPAEEEVAFRLRFDGQELRGRIEAFAMLFSLDPSHSFSRKEVAGVADLLEITRAVSRYRGKIRKFKMSMLSYWFTYAYDAEASELWSLFFETAASAFVFVSVVALVVAGALQLPLDSALSPKSRPHDCKSWLCKDTR